MAQRHVICHYWLLILVSIGVAIGCGRSSQNARQDKGRPRSDFNMPTEPNSAPSEPQLPESKSVAEEPDATLTVKEWFAAMRGDGEDIHKYDGKTLRMSGKVLEFDAARYPGVVATVIGIDGFTVDRFWCARKEEIAPWQEVSIGDDVTLRGVCTLSDLYGPFIYPYVIEQTSGGPMPVYQATELARKFKEDPEGMQKKYKSNNVELLVEGEVVRSNVEEDIYPYTATHILKGYEDIEFAVSIPPATQRGSEWIGVGDKVLLLGTMMVPTLDSQHKIGLGVASCLTLPPK